MKNNNLQNWNQLDYAKYSFWQEPIFIRDLKINICVYLKMDYSNRENAKFEVNSEIIIINNGKLLFLENKETILHNLFRLKKISELHLYILPYEEEMIKRALNYAKEKIKESQGTGTTMMHVSKGSMEERIVPLPPIAVQEYIVKSMASLEQETKRLESIYQQKLNEFQNQFCFSISFI